MEALLHDVHFSIIEYRNMLNYVDGNMVADG